jgi:hypothetical protein
MTDIETRNKILYNKIHNKGKYEWDLILTAPITIGDEDLTARGLKRSFNAEVVSAHAQLLKVNKKNIVDDLLPKCRNLFKLLRQSAQKKMIGIEAHRNQMKR